MKNTIRTATKTKCYKCKKFKIKRWWFDEFIIEANNKEEAIEKGKYNWNEPYLDSVSAERISIKENKRTQK